MIFDICHPSLHVSIISLLIINNSITSHFRLMTTTISNWMRFTRGYNYMYVVSQLTHFNFTRTQCYIQFDILVRPSVRTPVCPSVFISISFHKLSVRLRIKMFHLTFFNLS